MINNDVIFKTAAQSDLADIISIWKSCFHDSDAYISRFFDSIRLDDNVIIARKSDKIAAHASAVPLTLRTKDIELNGVYIYAACVSPDFRGEGIFRHLLDFTDAYAAERKLDFIYLIPASPSLAQTYEKYGYTHKINGICPLGDNGIYGLTLPDEVLSSIPLTEFDGDYDTLYSLYTKNESKGFIKPRGFFEFTVRECIPPAQIFITGEKDKNPNGFMIYTRTEGKNLINILQICCSDETNNGIMSDIKKKAKPYAKGLCKMINKTGISFDGIAADLFAEF